MISLESFQQSGNMLLNEQRKVDKEASLYVRYGKRVFDVVFAMLVTLCILSWLLPITGALIMMSSPGPIFFIQPRTGRKGRPFRCLKLRTMRHDEQKEFRQATKHDDRVTNIGRILRKTNLDEMPQFLNVLMGHMSIVGPRPHAVQHDIQFWDAFPEYKNRYTVKPGITGLAQVRGARGETDKLIKMQHRVRYDLYYKQRQSFWLDVRICWWTVKSMVKGNVNAW